MKPGATVLQAHNAPPPLTFAAGLLMECATEGTTWKPPPRLGREGAATPLTKDKLSYLPLSSNRDIVTIAPFRNGARHRIHPYEAIAIATKLPGGLPAERE